MRQFYFLLIVYSLFISCKSTEKTNGYGETDRTCRKYENDITYVHNRFEPVLKVIGKWRALSMNSKYYVNSKKTTLISNDKNEILRLDHFFSHPCKICKDENEILHYNSRQFLSSLKRKIEYWKNYENYTIELIETNEEDFAIYQLTGTKEKKSVMYGFKKDTFYEFTLLNSEQNKKEQANLLNHCFQLN